MNIFNVSNDSLTSMFIIILDKLFGLVLLSMLVYINSITKDLILGYTTYIY